MEKWREEAIYIAARCCDGDAAPAGLLREAVNALSAVEGKLAQSENERDAFFETARLAEKRATDAEKDALAMLNLFARFLQPGGSPPGLQGVGFAEWIARTVRERMDAERTLADRMANELLLKGLLVGDALIAYRKVRG